LRISRTLLRKVPSSESLAVERLGYKFAITQEKGFLVGNGVNQPLGVFTPSPLGISTGRDVATGNEATKITMTGLINAKYTLKGAYWPRAKWLFHRDAVKQIALLRDDAGGAGTGQYLWMPSVREGEPDSLLGRPMMVSEYTPNTFTTGKYVGIFGDFSHYWIADSLQMEMQRLVEKYAELNQIALIGRMESDGMPVLEEAFVRIKLG
jgi:HK97 family phage major capsid protein